MWDLYADLEELCETTANELKEANKKIRSAGGKVSPSDLEYLDKIAHLIKSVKTTMAMMDAEGGSGASYARRRDSMGRFTRANRSNRGRSGAYGEGSYGEGSYGEGSYGDGYGGRSNAYEGGRSNALDGGMMAELRELMEDAPDERTRQKFQKFIQELGR